MRDGEGLQLGQAGANGGERWVRDCECLDQLQSLQILSARTSGGQGSAWQCARLGGTSGYLALGYHGQYSLRHALAVLDLQL